MVCGARVLWECLQQANAVARGALLPAVLVEFAAVDELSPFLAHALKLRVRLHWHAQQALERDVVGQEWHKALLQDAAVCVSVHCVASSHLCHLLATIFCSMSSRSSHYKSGSHHVEIGESRRQTLTNCSTDAHALIEHYTAETKQEIGVTASTVFLDSETCCD